MILSAPAITHSDNDLKRIYRLRVTAWRESGLISSDRYPEGWSDELDQQAIHWVIKHSKNIVAAARLNILESLDELPYPGVFQDYEIPNLNPIAFYSRLVAHPDYRGRGISKQLDSVRLDYINKNKIPLVIATARNWRIDKLKKVGFKVLGKVNRDSDKRWQLGNASVIIKVL